MMAMFYFEIECKTVSSELGRECYQLYQGTGYLGQRCPGIEKYTTPVFSSQEMNQWFTLDVVLCVGDSKFLPRHFVYMNGHPILIVDEIFEEWESFHAQIFPLFGEGLLKLKQMIEQVYNSCEVIRAYQKLQACRMEFIRQVRKRELDDESLAMIQSETEVSCSYKGFIINV
jgi:hypothetical protein